MITLDNMAHRYGVLPSEALARATTLDLKVLDVSAKWDRHRQQKADGTLAKPDLTQEEMMAMIKNVKERRKNDTI